MKRGAIFIQRQLVSLAILASLLYRICCSRSDTFSFVGLDASSFVGSRAGVGQPLFSVHFRFAILPELPPGETEARLLLVRLDCIGSKNDKFLADELLEVTVPSPWTC